MGRVLFFSQEPEGLSYRPCSLPQTERMKKGNKASMCSVSAEHDFKEGQSTPTKGGEDLFRSS